MILAMFIFSTDAGVWFIGKWPLKSNWTTWYVKLRYCFYMWINHFKILQQSTRWNWKYRTIFHSPLQLSALLFTSFKFNSLYQGAQSIVWCHNVPGIMHSTVPECLSMLYSIFFGCLHTYIGEDIWEIVCTRDNYFEMWVCSSKIRI